MGIIILTNNAIYGCADLSTLEYCLYILRVRSHFSVPHPAYCPSRLSTTATVLYHDTYMQISHRRDGSYWIDSHKVEKFNSTPISTAIYLCNIRTTTQTTTTTTATAIINKARMKPARLQSHPQNCSPPVPLGLFTPRPTKKATVLLFSRTTVTMASMPTQSCSRANLLTTIKILYQTVHITKEHVANYFAKNPLVIRVWSRAVIQSSPTLCLFFCIYIYQISCGL